MDHPPPAIKITDSNKDNIKMEKTCLSSLLDTQSGFFGNYFMAEMTAWILYLGYSFAENLWF
jgi:hypothetical protein